jgi:general secretion pathway protein J
MPVQRGFTLLEILIAMAIFTLIGFASTGLLSTVIDSNSLSGERVDKLQAMQRAMTIIERDIQQIIPRPVRLDGEKNDVVIQGGIGDESDADSLRFVRAGWLNPQFILPRSTLESVSYQLVEKRLERLSGNYLDNAIGFEPKERVLLDDVSDFRVEFFVGDTKDGELNWRDSYTGAVLPQAIAVEIETDTFGIIRREFSLVAPHTPSSISAGASENGNQNPSDSNNLNDISSTGRGQNQ